MNVQAGISLSLLKIPSAPEFETPARIAIELMRQVRRAAIRTTNGRLLIEIENPLMNRSSYARVRATARRFLSGNQ